MTWIAIPGYEGLYEVSENGGIRRIGRGRGVKIGGRELRQANHNQGYKAVSLWKDNHGRTYLVHRLVAVAFLGPIPEGHEVNHKDGDKRNNGIGNLEYISGIDNVHHAIAIGKTNNSGEKNTQAKLTDAEVIEIRASYSFGGYRVGGTGYKALAKKYGVSWGAIRNIVKGRTWTLSV